MKELEEVKKAVEVCGPLIVAFSVLIPSLQSLEAERTTTEARDVAERRKLEAERLAVAIAEAEVRVKC